MLIDSGLQSLALVAQLHQVAVDGDHLQREFGRVGHVCSEHELLRAARKLGFKARCVRPESLDGLDRYFPAIAGTTDGNYFVLAQRTIGKDGKSRFLIQRPQMASPETLEQEPFETLWSGELVLIGVRGNLRESSLERFNLHWFAPSLKKYRRLFTEVVVASFLIQMFALVTPLFFQVVMDKVLVHKAYTTLNVLAFGFVVIVLFDAVVGGLRNYLFSHTTSRVDVELGARLFSHLVRLPLAYFETRQVGQTVARVRELDSLRNFITGTALTLLIDLSFTFVFIAVLWYYSPILTWIVLGSLPFYVGLSLFVTPVLKRRLDTKFRDGAASQSFLTEAVTGIHTVKSQALEPQMQRRWEDLLANYTRSTFQAGNLNSIASQIAGVISKITTLLIIWWGAHLVINGQLSVGQLVAFNMIAGRITGPILKLVQLWQDFQQAGISLQRLGDILNKPCEPNSLSNRSSPRSLQGAITLEGVRFRYGQDAPVVIEGLSLDIRPGEVVGIVGRSGSGKSTLAQLIQRMYVPESGRIRIDGADLATVDTAWLRRSVGVVQQESFLFNRTVRENIALANPGMSFERVVGCARVAGAHEFILDLPEGYDTVIDEQGSNLSGGQRQRIAIARALINDPRILILDEATSALDYESERIIQENMGAIARQRTVLIIAHRLTTVRHCDQIVVLDKGRIIERGTHDQLLDINGYYARLYSYQNHSPLIRPLASPGESGADCTTAPGV